MIANLDEAFQGKTVKRRARIPRAEFSGIDACPTGKSE